MAAQADLPPRRLALLIATSKYSDPALQQLRAPGHDAKDLAEVLSNRRIGGFAVQTLINARCGELLQAIEDFCADRRLDDQLLIYLSCHGVLDDRGRLYYAATDTRRHRTAATAIAAAWLNERLEDCRARVQIVILDCCHSGAFASGAKGGSDLALEQRFRPHGRGRIVLTASRGTEYSFEGDQPFGTGMRSVFTKAIVDGLRTGDADRDQDGSITISDIYQYTYDRVRAVEPRQTPALWTYGAEGDVLLAHSVRGAIIRPVPLAEDLRLNLESLRPRFRETAVAELAGLLDTAPPGLALSARQALERISAEDIPRVADVARVALGASQGKAAREVSRELAMREQRKQVAQQAAERKTHKPEHRAVKQQAADQAHRAAQKASEWNVFKRVRQLARRSDEWQAAEEARRGATTRANGFERVVASLGYLLPMLALITAFRRNSFIRTNAIQALIITGISFVAVVTIGPAYNNPRPNVYTPAVSQPWFGILIALGIIAISISAILLLFCLLRVLQGRLPRIILVTRMATRLAALISRDRRQSIPDASDHHLRGVVG
jgi:caspase domain-containing protein